MIEMKYMKKNGKRPIRIFLDRKFRNRKTDKNCSLCQLPTIGFRMQLIEPTLYSSIYCTQATVGRSPTGCSGET